MNGLVIAEKIIDTTFATVSIYDPKNVGKKLHYESDQVFMVKFANGDRRYYYEQDSTNGNIFTREEMWLYSKGEADAHKGFKARGAFITSTTFGVLGGMTGAFWGPALPFLYISSNGITKIRIKHETVSNPRYLTYDAYLLGYERVARQKRKTRSFIGSGIGIATGYLFYALFHNYYPK